MLASCSYNDRDKFLFGVVKPGGSVLAKLYISRPNAVRRKRRNFNDARVRTVQARGEELQPRWRNRIRSVTLVALLGKSICKFVELACFNRCTTEKLRPLAGSGQTKVGLNDISIPVARYNPFGSVVVYIFSSDNRRNVYTWCCCFKSHALGRAKPWKNVPTASWLSTVVTIDTSAGTVSTRVS